MVQIRKPEVTPREQPDEGTHSARLLGITDLGHQPGFVYNGKTIPSEYKLEFTYELVSSKMEDGRPFLISEELTNKDWEDEKTGRASTLVARAKALLGKSYKDGLSNPDKLIGCPCMVSVTYNDKGYARLRGQAAVGSTPIGYKVDEMENKPFTFDTAEPDMDIWAAMPDFKKEKITNAFDFNETQLAKILAEGDEY